MAFNIEFKNHPIKILLSNTLSAGDANDFVAITTNVTGVNTSTANVGFQIKNIATDADSYFYIKHINTNHGNNTGFKIGPGESLLVECTNISDIYIKANTDESISYQVIGN